MSTVGANVYGDSEIFEYVPPKKQDLEHCEEGKDYGAGDDVVVSDCSLSYDSDGYRVELEVLDKDAEWLDLMAMNGYDTRFILVEENKKKEVVFLDCQWVKSIRVGGVFSDLVSVVVLDSEGRTLVSYERIKPRGDVVDYLTEVTNIDETTEFGYYYHDVIGSVRQAISGKMVVGHTVWSDIRALDIGALEDFFDVASIFQPRSVSLQHMMLYAYDVVIQYKMRSNAPFDAWCVLLVYKRYEMIIEQILDGKNRVMYSYDVDGFLVDNAERACSVVTDVADCKRLYYRRRLLSEQVITVNQMSVERRDQWKRSRCKPEYGEDKLRVPKYDITNFLFFRKKVGKYVRVKRTEIACKYHGETCMLRYEFVGVQVDTIFRCKRYFNSRELVLASVYGECIARYQVKDKIVSAYSVCDVGLYYEFYKKFYYQCAVSLAMDGYRSEFSHAPSVITLKVWADNFARVSDLAKWYDMKVVRNENKEGFNNVRFYGTVSQVVDFLRNCLGMRYHVVKV